VIAKLYAGWKIRIDGAEYLVLGSQSLRGNYFYIIEAVSDKTKKRLSRKDFLALQTQNVLEVVG
jgi:hypothetical protein